MFVKQLAEKGGLQSKVRAGAGHIKGASTHFCFFVFFTTFVLKRYILVSDFPSKNAF